MFAPEVNLQALDLPKKNPGFGPKPLLPHNNNLCDATSFSAIAESVNPVASPEFL